MLGDKKKSPHKGEMLEGNGGKSKVMHRLAQRNSCRLLRAPGVAGARQRSSVPEDWSSFNVTGTTPL